MAKEIPYLDVQNLTKSFGALMLFKDKLGGDDDTMKLLLMSSMMGGNMAGSNNPLMSYLMLDAFMGKKDGKTPQTGEGAAE